MGSDLTLAQKKFLERERERERERDRDRERERERERDTLGCAILHVIRLRLDLITRGKK